MDNQLRLNRKILKEYNKGGKVTIRAKVLLELGFDPRFFTHYWKNKKGRSISLFMNMGFWKRKKTARTSMCWSHGRIIWHDIMGRRLRGRSRGLLVDLPQAPAEAEKPPPPSPTVRATFARPYTVGFPPSVSSSLGTARKPNRPKGPFDLFPPWPQKRGVNDYFPTFPKKIWWQNLYP